MKCSATERCRAYGPRRRRRWRTGCWPAIGHEKFILDLASDRHTGALLADDTADIMT